MGYVVSSYLNCVYDVERFRKTFNRVSSALRALKKRVKFEAIAFRGSSGAALAYPYSLKFGTPLIHVRKSWERRESHCSHIVEGFYEVKRYIILDDAISSGNTIRTIVDEIKNSYENFGHIAPELGAIVFYNMVFGSAWPSAWKDVTCHHRGLIETLGKKHTECRVIRCGA
jgi:hypothetical protein